MKINRIRPNVKALLIILIAQSISTYAATDKEGRNGVYFEDNMKGYKPPVEFYDGTGREDLDSTFERIKGMKESGAWRLDNSTMSGVEGSDLKSKKYPTVKGNSADPNHFSDSLDPNNLRLGTDMDRFLSQPMSPRQRNLLLAAASNLNKKYGQGPDRIKIGGKETDCSGFIYLAAKIAGIKYANSSSAGTPGSPDLIEVSWDDRQPGDVMWRSGHVEMYIGKDDSGKEFRAGAHKPGVNSNISKFNIQNKSNFTRIFRFKGRDNPLTPAELQKMNGK